MKNIFSHSRENHRKQAKYYYQLVNVVQPYAAKGWIEFAKMKEENGDLRACTKYDRIEDRRMDWLLLTC